MRFSNQNLNRISHRRGHSAGSGRRLQAKRMALVWTFGIAIAALGLMAGCGTAVTILTLTAPPTATPGMPFSVTVNARADGNRDKIFNMDVHFTSSDGAAILPIDYTFTATDAGSHTFTNGIILMTPGTQTITATATFAPSVTGSTNVTVQNAPASSGH